MSTQSPVILLAEDDDHIRFLMQRTLEQHGYRVLTAGDGAAALQLARDTAEPIHLLVTDVIMPNMDGLQLAEEMADIRPQTPILFISGYVESHLVEASRKATVLRKPFTAEALLSKVRELLKGVRPPGAGSD